MLIKEWSCSNVQPCCHSLHTTEITKHCDPVAFRRFKQPHPDIGFHVFLSTSMQVLLQQFRKFAGFPPASFIIYNSEIILPYVDIKLRYLIERCETEEESTTVSKNCEGKQYISSRHNVFYRI
jgi:hypothetical protein